MARGKRTSKRAKRTMVNSQYRRLVPKPLIRAEIDQDLKDILVNVDSREEKIEILLLAILREIKRGNV